MQPENHCGPSAITIGLIPLLLACAILAAQAETETDQARCAKTGSFLAPLDTPEHRQYAPDREIDILHLALDVTPNFKLRTVTGKAEFRFKPIAKPLPVLRLDAVDLEIESVVTSPPVRDFQVTDKQLVVTFAQPIPADQETTVTIQYHAEPTRGLYFRTPDMGYKDGETHLFTQGEAIEARHWYPCYDFPNEKFTSEITCRVPEGMIVLSNGKLLGEVKDANTGLVTFRWSQDKPHVNYLISLIAGYFKKVQDQYRDIPLAFYTPPSAINEAPSSFRDTRDMMAFFEQEIGMPYPWNKYDQVCVNDFVAGGMENTSITTLTDSTLFTTNSETIHSSEGLISHELSHQWFGDYVTCKDWSHLWLNEGFATYYEILYAGHKHGRDSLNYELYQNAKTILGQADDTRAIVTREFNSPDDQFGYRAYQKGGWVLHMLRSQLGDDLYRRCIKTYLDRHPYGLVETGDLTAVIEELSGRSFDQFFDQWIYHGHYPELEVSYGWDEPTRLAKISIQQVQKLSEKVLLFNLPVSVRFRSKSGTTDRQITVKQRAEDFYFPLTEAPQIVRVDPDYTLLAKITFGVPPPMLFAQLADAQDMMGRLLAVLELAKRTDRETVTRLREVLNGDVFYGVRLEAAKALRTIHSDDAFEALRASIQQPDARVRQQVVMAISGFYRQPALESARQILGTEKNPDIQSPAISALGPYSQDQVREILLQFLGSQSYRNELANAAVRAMRAQDDPGYVRPLLECLERRENDFATYGFTSGLATLAFLDRNEEKKDEVREFLLRQINHKKDRVRIAAINALGALEDPKAIPALNTFTTALKDSPERSAAERAVAALRAAKKPADDLRDLRNEVLDLQKANRDLRKELDDLKKRTEALAPKTGPTKSPPKKPSGTPAKGLRGN